MKILVNGNFITMNNKHIEALVFDDKIYYAGSMKEALKFDGEIVDLKGKTVIPGLIDLTIEFLNVAERKAFIDLQHCTSIEEIRLTIEANYGKHPILIGYGYDNNKLRERRDLTKEDIEYDFPVVIVHINNDKGVVNQSFMSKYNVYNDVLLRDDLYKVLFNISEMKEVLNSNMPYALTFYYEKGFVTQVARVHNEFDKLIIEDTNLSSLVLMEYIENLGIKRKIIRIDTDTRNYLLYEAEELKELLIECAKNDTHAYLLAHSQGAIDLIKEALLDFEYDINRWTLLSSIYLFRDDIVFFARRGFHFSVLLKQEFKMREEANYSFFDYLIQLERHDVEYSIFDDRTVDEFNIFEELRLLFKVKHFYEDTWKRRLYNIFKAMTINKAYSLVLEDKIGQIEEGYSANLVVLNDNPFESLDGIDVIDVYKNGKVVYSINKK